MKVLISLAVLAIVLPIYGQEKRPKTGTDQNRSENVNKAESPTPEVVVVNQKNSSEQGDRPQDNPKPYFSRLFSPENVPNIALFFAGIAGILVALKTLEAIKRQADIQAAGMRQWVDVGTKGVDSPDSLKEPFTVHLKFEAVNNTAFPFTIEKIVTKVGLQADTWETFTVETSVTLPPSGEARHSAYPFYVAMKLSGIEAEWFKMGTVLTVNGEVTFKDCLQKTDVQWFGGLYKWGVDLFEYLEPLGIVPDQHTERDGQNPN